MRETNLANASVLYAESLSLDSGRIDFPLQIATWSILCSKVSQEDFPYECVLQSQ